MAVACRTACGRTVHPLASKTCAMTRRAQFRQVAQAKSSTSRGAQIKMTPFISLLFNSVSESIVRRAEQQWASKGYGFKLQVRTNDRLANLRFA
eukprot:7075742-Pyramimonas_sp.AAC.1